MKKEPVVFLSVVNLIMKHPIFKKMNKINVKKIVSDMGYLIILKKN